MTPDVARPHAVIAFEAVVAALAAALLTAMVAMALDHPELSSAINPVTIGVALCAPVLARFGVSVEAKAQSVSVTFETAALVLLLFIAPSPEIGLTLWCLLVPLGLITDRTRWRVHLFNVSLTVLCGVGLAGTLQAIGASDPTQTQTLLAVAAGIAVATVIDLGLSGVHVYLRTGQHLGRLFGADDILIGSFVASGTASLGYLGALLHQLDAPWVMLILLAPVVSVIVASRATRQSMDDERRLAVLLQSSSDRRDLDSAEAILDSALRHAGVLLGSPNAGLSASPPVGDWIGALIELGAGESTWLVAPPRRDRSTWLPSERRALATLAADTAESIARTHLIRELSRMARLDGLSGLANRTTFTEAVGHSVAAGNTNGAYPTLLYLDLDNFKQVNDLYGHHVGDALVREVAARLLGCVPEGGLAARLGGDEFAMLIGHHQDADAVAHTIITRLGQVFAIEGHHLTVTASVGIAAGGADLGVDRLFHNADLAMYHAKAERLAGPARYHDGLRARDRERHALRSDLADAVVNGELRVVYQPVQHLMNGTVDGVEALVRWEHPTRGMLTAGDFIEIAEESGQIQHIGEWVLRKAMQDGERMAAAAGRPLSVAVNVSPRQLGDDRLIDVVREMLRSSRSGTHLVLELTESAVITEDPAIRRRLESLVQAGVTLALDDFGVGYSSVGYLRWLPMHILKLDRSLLTSITCDPKARSLVQALLVMGRALGLVVVAEGIERADEARVLHELGCPLGQGWYLARPLTLVDLEQYLSGDHGTVTQRISRRVLAQPEPIN